jgi:hypothetical protein
MTGIDPSRAEWRKSSYSSQSGNCVEVARKPPWLVAVRDSKEPDGAKLLVSHEAWRAFIGDVRAVTVDSQGQLGHARRVASDGPLLARADTPLKTLLEHVEVRALPPARVAEVLAEQDSRARPHHANGTGTTR